MVSGSSHLTMMLDLFRLRICLLQRTDDIRFDSRHTDHNINVSLATPRETADGAMGQSYIAGKPLRCVITQNSSMRRLECITQMHDANLKHQGVGGTQNAFRNNTTAKCFKVICSMMWEQPDRTSVNKSSNMWRCARLSLDVTNIILDIYLMS